MMTPRRIWTSLTAIIVVGAMLAGVDSALAQSSDTLTIDDVAKDATGRIAVNAAVGVYNQQVNSAAIAESNIAYAKNIVTQILVGNEVCIVVGDECGSSDPHASITGYAFDGAQGLISFNGAAGTENQQANLATFGFSNGIVGRVASLTALGQIRATPEPAGGTIAPPAEKATNIDSTAFSDIAGVLQSNLTAGERNSSANLFGLTVTGGTD
jgi:hypothetical protein